MNNVDLSLEIENILFKINQTINILNSYKTNKKKYDKFVFKITNEVIPLFYQLQQMKFNYFTVDEFDYMLSILKIYNQEHLKKILISLDINIKNKYEIENKSTINDFFSTYSMFIFFEKKYFKHPNLEIIRKAQKDIIYIVVEGFKFLIKNYSIKLMKENIYNSLDDIEVILIESLIRKLYSFNPNMNCIFASYFFNEIKNQINLYKKNSYDSFNLVQIDSYEYIEQDNTQLFNSFENKDLLITFLSFIYFNYDEKNFENIKENIIGIFHQRTNKFLPKTKEAIENFKRNIL